MDSTYAGSREILVECGIVFTDHATIQIRVLNEGTMLVSVNVLVFVVVVKLRSLYGNT
jgi:hypothetical protein